MWVRLNSIYAWPGGAAGPGEKLDLPDAEARALIEGGYGVAVESPYQTATEPSRQTAVTGPAETAVGVRPTVRRQRK